MPELRAAAGLDRRQSRRGADVTRHPVKVEKGEAQVLDRPGLGIEVDEDPVGRHRIDSKARPAA